jgi:quercetin dioxygenase-like cupin family protein
VKRWDLSSLPPSTEKETPREPGADAPRVPRRGGQIPRVLFTAPECRAVVIELAAGEAMGEHEVRERSVVHVHGGRISIEAGGDAVECGAGSVVTFDPGERHAVRAVEDAMLLLVLAPWPAADHYVEGDVDGTEHAPANASVAPLGRDAERSPREG